jgi:hypothetical protein
MTLPHRAPTDTEIDTLPRFLLTDPAPWSPTFLHNDDNTTSLLNHYVSFQHAREGTQGFHLLNLPDFPTRYVLHNSDDTTISSDDLTVFPDSNIFDFSQMELPHAYCSRIES